MAVAEHSDVRPIPWQEDSVASTKERNLRRQARAESQRHTRQRSLASMQTLEEEEDGGRGHIPAVCEYLTRNGRGFGSQVQGAFYGSQNARAARMNRPGSDVAEPQSVVSEPLGKPRSQVLG